MNTTDSPSPMKLALDRFMDGMMADRERVNARDAFLAGWRAAMEHKAGEAKRPATAGPERELLLAVTAGVMASMPGIGAGHLAGGRWRPAGGRPTG